MDVRMTPVGNIDFVDMKKDPVVERYLDLTLGLGARWGDTVVLDQCGGLLLGRRRYDRAVRLGESRVATTRIFTGPAEARLLRMADFCEGDGMFLLHLERILNPAPEAA